MDIRTVSELPELYTIAEQTIFQVCGVNGAPQLEWESYPAEFAPPEESGRCLDRGTAINRTKAEFEAEQRKLRKA